MAENQHVFPRKFKFFRVLLLGFSTKLAIPQRLVKCFINKNLKLVTLLSPLGKSWNVMIGGDSKGLHFAEGWERFAKAHRLSFGDLLVFKYVGGTVFHVTIFDKSTCEKDYKITNGVAGADHVPGQGETCDQESECFKGKTTSTPPSSGQRRTPPVMEQEFNKDRTQVSARKEVQKPVHTAKIKATKQMCKRGSHFEITISAKLKYTVRIPVKFSRSNDLSSDHQMLLRDPEGHSWPVNLLHCKHAASGQDRLLLGGGWRDFCMGNKLKDGDVCVFEVEKKDEMLVQIHRSCGDGSNGSKSPLQQSVQLKRAATPQQVGPPSKVIRRCEPADPVQFESTILPTNVCKNCYMTIPRAFLSLVDLSIEKEAVLVDPNSRQWPVKILSFKKRGWCRIGHGWKAFCEENVVEVGDVCIFSFKYIGKEATFHVEVIKAKAADGSCSRSKSPLQQAGRLKRAATLQQKGSPLKVACTSKPADPVQFASTISPINVYKKGGYMNIPKAFTSLVDLSAEKEIILVDPDSRRWPVKYCGTDGSRCRMLGGWRRFCEENDVEVGDVCIFKFKYRGNEATFQVELIKSKASNRN